MGIESLARPEIVALKPYSSARKEAPGRGILLNANESPWPLLDNLQDDSQLHRYPDPQPADLVTRLAQLYGVTEDNVLLTRGSDEGIDLLTRVFCRAGQDAILQCPPTFGMYAIAAGTQGAAVVAVPRDVENFELDQAAILRVLDSDPRIKLLFLTSPNNPTGDLLDDSFLLELLEACRDRAIVVLDEAYAEFCRQPSAARLLGGHENLVVLRTLSKAWAAAGLRCGTVLAQPAVIDLLRRVIAPYPLPSPVVDLARRMLANEAMAKQQLLLQQLVRNKKQLIDLLEGRSFIRQLFPGEANFVLIRVEDAAGLISFCAGRGVVVRGFASEPMLRDCVRITVGSEQDLDALAAVLDEWENTP
jgi:histidinol-phosphate aminotransferase